MQELLYNEGCRRLQEYDLKKSRIIVNLGNIFGVKKYASDADAEHNSNSEVNISEMIVNDAIKHFESTYEVMLSHMKKDIIVRENKLGFYMNWHIDDCSVIKHNTTDKVLDNNIIMNDKYALFHKKELPKYTMIIYLTGHEDDFLGGEFEFVDKIIKPKKYDVIFFDSREVHRVNTLRKGIRKNILVKFFEPT
jgi:hypothetical protein